MIKCFEANHQNIGALKMNTIKIRFTIGKVYSIGHLQSRLESVEQLNRKYKSGCCFIIRIKNGDLIYYSEKNHESRLNTHNTLKALGCIG